VAQDRPQHLHYSDNFNDTDNDNFPATSKWHNMVPIIWRQLAFNETTTTTEPIEPWVFSIVGAQGG
jgi:hypothetical protein